MKRGPVMVMAGGTGGHIFPGLAVAEELRRQSTEVIWLGSRAGLENELVPPRGVPIETLSISAIRGKGKLALALMPIKLLRAVWQALGILRRHQPRSVLSMGGFAAAPGGIAAWLLACPLVVHEQNKIPGLTNRLLARFANRLLARLAKRVLGGFPDAFANSEHVGNPVRDEIIALESPAARWRDRSGPIRLLVLGGSQGAQSINRVLPEALQLMDPVDRPAIWHQMGQRDLVDGTSCYREAGVEGKLVAFIEQIGEAYAWADLVLCRAGALTLAELAAAGLGAILVPYPYAVDDHQTANARYLVEAGAALLLPEAELTAEALSQQLQQLSADRAKLLAMADAARKEVKAGATARVAQVCLEVANG